MKDAIVEYLDYSEKEKKEIWGKSTFIFDTNVLLNLYRYTKKTRDEFLAILEAKENELWIPYQVMKEFGRNRKGLIYEIKDKYDGSLNNVMETIKESAKNTFIRGEIQSDFSSLEEHVNKWISSFKKENPIIQNPSQDEILDKLSALYTGKINGYPKQIDNLLEKCKERIEESRPPGLRDVDKADIKEHKWKNDGTLGYGDILIWFEILEYAKEKKTNIVFVTDDRKDDWWWKEKGRTLGILPPLKKEFISETKMNILFYGFEQFLNIYAKLENTKVSKDFVDEVKDISNHYDDMIELFAGNFDSRDPQIGNGKSHYYSKLGILPLDLLEYGMLIDMLRIGDMPEIYERKLLEAINNLRKINNLLESYNNYLLAEKLSPSGHVGRIIGKLKNLLTLQKRAPSFDENLLERIYLESSFAKEKLLLHMERIKIINKNYYKY